MCGLRQSDLESFFYFISLSKYKEGVVRACCPMFVCNLQHVLRCIIPQSNKAANRLFPFPLAAVCFPGAAGNIHVQTPG